MNIYDTLNPEQLKAVKHQKGPLLILAGAGSGKTRVLTHRIAYLIDEGNVNPWNILALTFTNKAANEMRERVDKIVGYGSENIWVSTFHSTCVRILRRHIELLGYEKSFTIYDAADQKTLLREILKYLDIDTKRFKERSFLSAISAAKDELINTEEYTVNAGSDMVKSKYAAVYREYQKRLKKNNALDFDDLIFKTVELFRSYPEPLMYYQNRFKYIMVDEYQDTNTAQFQLIRILASTPGDHGDTEHNLCVVGDDDQSIYKFRGANIYNILNFEREYPDTCVIKLEQNYRSTKNILEAANQVIQHNTERKAKALWTDKEEGAPLSFTQYDTEYEEASHIANDIYQIIGKQDSFDSDPEADFENRSPLYKDFAVLYRTNAQSRILEEKFVQKNIPYKIIGAVNFYQRKEIKDILSYLKTIDNGLDDIAVKRVINIPRRGIGLTTIDRVTEYAIQQDISFYEALRHSEFIPGLGRSTGKISPFVSLIEILKSRLSDPDYSIHDLLDEVIEATGYLQELVTDGSEEALGRIENIDELRNKIISYENGCDERPTLSGFLEEVALVADIDNLSESNNMVVLMTLHSAKGLEFPYVYLCGMEDGVFPGYITINSDDPTEIEEERRLCYVGITRAMKKLSLSAARQRMQHGETQFNKPSRFINEIPRYLMTETRSKIPPLLNKPHPSPQKEIRGAMANMASTDHLFSSNPFIQKGLTVPSHAAVKQSLSAPLSSPPDYQIGDTVRHAKFGNGIVTDLKKGIRDYEVCVDFEGTGSKKMQAGFAQLTKITF